VAPTVLLAATEVVGTGDGDLEVGVDQDGIAVEAGVDRLLEAKAETGVEEIDRPAAAEVAARKGVDASEVEASPDPIRKRKKTLADDPTHGRGRLHGRNFENDPRLPAALLLMITAW